MKKTLMIVLALVLVAGMAYGMPEKEKTPIGETPIFNLRADYTEEEPNNDCGMANGPFVLGDSFLGSITADDTDWFQYTAGAGNCVLFQLAQPEGSEDPVDTKMWLWADDCVTELAYNDDYAGLYSGFEVGPLAPGTYYIQVSGFGSSTGDYVLMTSLVECPPPPPVNDTCDGAIDLQEQGLAEFEIDLCLYANDYSPASPSCTGYSANGSDALYKIYLEQGETFIACTNPCEGTFTDLSTWLVTDCGDVENTCVAGDDSGNPECVNYTAAEAGWYYLVVDAYSSCGCVIVTINDPVATDDATWGSVKTMYR